MGVELDKEQEKAIKASKAKAAEDAAALRAKTQSVAVTNKDEAEDKKSAGGLSKQSSSKLHEAGEPKSPSPS